MEQDLTLREALAEDRLDDFVQQEEDKGVELANGSEFERALALLITQRMSDTRSERFTSRRVFTSAGMAANAHSVQGTALQGRRASGLDKDKAAGRLPRGDSPLIRPPETNFSCPPGKPLWPFWHRLPSRSRERCTFQWIRIRLMSALGPLADITTRS